MTPATDLASRMIGHLNQDAFASKLDEGLREIVDFDLTAVLGFPLGEKPQLLHDGLGHVSTPQVMKTYLNSTFLLDAVYVACTKGIADNLYRLSELAPDEFFQTQYYNSPSVHPCVSLESGSLTEEIVFITQPISGYYLCYSLMRSSQFARFSSEEFHKLQELSSLVFALISKHWANAFEQRAPNLKLPGQQALDSAFASFKSELLSPREQHIVSLILRGHSSVSVANVLGIAEGTVKNHRKHIHVKLGVASQGELFNQFLGHILSLA
jgi:DNA-binding CsgD family transcriptional regulator